MSDQAPVSIAVLNQKGGVGKSTLATNLAAAFLLAGRRTLLIDLDRQGSSLDWNAARQEGSVLEGLATVKYDKPLGLPRFRAVAEGYGAVVLDGPPQVGEITRSAAVVADLVVLPVTPSFVDMWAMAGTLDLLDTADGIREELGRPPVRRLFVISRAVVGTSLSRSSKKPLEELGLVAGVSIHTRQAFIQAMGLGESVLTAFPKSEAAFEIRGLYRELTKTIAQGAS